MTTAAPLHPAVHLVGSVPLDSSEAVFRTVCGALGPYLKRLPDGETGERGSWIGFIFRKISKHPDFEKDSATPPLEWRQWDGVLLTTIPQFKFKDGVDPARVAYDTGYAAAAIESFKAFDRLQSAGTIPPGIRFQICLATPLAIAYMVIAPQCRAGFIAGYTRHLVAEIDRIAASLPNERIAIQWDVCQEVLMWEGYFRQHAGYKDEVLRVLAEIGNAVPVSIELGYHLCYGSPKDEHLVQPKDMANMVEILTGLFEGIRRPIDFIHLPVPNNRSDDAYFAPLKALAVPAETELYLGCVHDRDDAGNAERLAAAQKFAAISGIGSECGWGRGDPERLPGILDAHKTLAGAGAD